MLGRLQYLRGPSYLDDAPEIHHRHAVGNVPRQTEIVCHHEDREPQLGAQPL